MLRVCRGCGVPFQHAGNTRGLFCSLPCYWAYQRTRPPEYRKVEHVTLTCPTCGGEFTRRRQEVRGAFQFCSKSCAGRVSGNTPLRSPRRPAAEKRCEECGRTYSVKGSQEGRRRFCTKVCEMAFRSRVMVGRGNPNYRHGQDQTSAKTTALRAYPARCAVCGFDVILDVHHIVPKSRRGTNDVDNLILLCPNHHRMVKLGLISAEQLRALSLTLRREIPVGLDGLTVGTQPAKTNKDF